MRVATGPDEYSPVSLRSGWPQAGTSYQLDWSSQWSSIELAPLASGEMRLASFAAIYKTNPWVFSAINLIASGIGRLPIHLYGLLPDGGRARVRADLPGQVGRPSAAQQLAHRLGHPGPGISRPRLIRRTLTDRLVYGNSLWAIDRPAGQSVPNAIWHVPWKSVVVHEGNKVPVLSYELRGPKASNFYAPEEVVHIGPESNSDAPVGVSPLEPLRYSLRLLDAIQRQLASYFGNAARPSGVFRVGPNTSQNDLATVRETIRQMYTSPENAGKVLVTSAEWQSLGAPPAQNDVIELIKRSREEILTAFQIPPPLAGILDGAIKSNVAELRQQYLRDVCGPWAELIESEIEAQLIDRLPAVNNHFVEFQFGEVLRPDLSTRAAAYKALESVYSPDEFRRLENLPPIGTPDATVPTTPLNMRPLGLPSSAYGGATQPGTEADKGPAPTPTDDEGDDEGDGDEDLV